VSKYQFVIEVEVHDEDKVIKAARQARTQAAEVAEVEDKFIEAARRAWERDVFGDIVSARSAVRDLADAFDELFSLPEWTGGPLKIGFEIYSKRLVEG
jgi:hypothetical protein